VVEVSFANLPHWDAIASVDVDGELPLGPAGRVRIEGLSETAARDAVANATGVEQASVSLRVVDTRAARVFVCGPENGKQRPVPYRGPERALDFLWRVGAVKKGCSDLDDVYVVRSNVSNGGRPQVLRVDVAAVVIDGNAESNVVLQPSDQVYIGETRRSRFGRLVPDWLQPLYRKLVGLFPTEVLPRRFTR
jgi:protein involved in polysaccharide export with SLBB domain